MSSSRNRSGEAGWMRIERRPLRVAHRGAGAFEPHNTLRSFRRALDAGVEMIETDLRAAADGTLVLAHDPEIHAVDGRTCDVAGATLRELRQYDLGEGERLCTLDDLIDLSLDRAALMIDLKGEGFESALVQCLKDRACRDVVIPGGSALSRHRIRSLDPTIPLSLSLSGPPTGGLTEAYLDAIDTDAVTWHFSLLNRERIAALHARGLRVFAWTVDSAGEMRRLVEDGVDGMISNRTDLLAELPAETAG